MPGPAAHKPRLGSSARPERLPPHCRVQVEPSPKVDAMRRLLRRRGLHSVCEEARCPNLRDCFARGTTTFMLLGDVCTRACRFCNVATGIGRAVSTAEPRQVAEAVAELGLRHVVLTSVNRDDLADQGAGQFARTVGALRAAAPGVTIEVLTPDFRGDAACIDTVLDARPDVYNHNLETVPRLYPRVRIGARYARSLELLRRVAQAPDAPLSKSGLMLGLGETSDEIVAVLSDLRAVGVECVTLGQYLRPTLRHLAVERYLDPSEFDDLRERALSLGFTHVASGPLVRSSFHADTAYALIRERGGVGA